MSGVKAHSQRASAKAMLIMYKGSELSFRFYEVFTVPITTKEPFRFRSM